MEEGTAGAIVDQSASGQAKEGYLITDDDYFMSLAVLTSKRSKDPITQVGACIVTADNQVVGLGYNSMPNGFPDNEADWDKQNKKPFVCHAELNAIVNGLGCHGVAGLSACRIYVTLAPCNECAKLIIQSGIGEVIYLSDEKRARDYSIKAKEMLSKASVKCSPFPPSQMDINISLGKEDLVTASA